MTRSYLTALLFLAMSHPVSCWAQGASFEGLGNLGPGGWSGADDVSGDGSTIVGWASGRTGNEAFRWTIDEGMTGFGNGGGLFITQAHGVSADGSVVVGQGMEEAFRWTAGEGMIGLGKLPGFGASLAQCVSADGSTVVGFNHVGAGVGMDAFRWTAEDGMIGLGDLPGAPAFGFSNPDRSQARAVAADGSIIVGVGLGTSGIEAVRWTIEEGIVGLGDLPGGGFQSEAFGISADGSTIVGSARIPFGTEAFRWTAAEGMTGLGHIGPLFSRAFDASVDGTVIVGEARSSSGAEAFIWDASRGMRNLKSVLEEDYGLNLSAWTLRAATAISDDGRVIVGDGIFNGSRFEGWRAVLPSGNTGPDVTCPVGATAECVNGGANILVEAAVFDADGDPLLVEWLVTYPDGTSRLIADTVTFADPPVPVAIGLVDPDGSPAGAFFFPHGNSTVELRVTDGIAETHACSPVTIMVEDTEGPVIVMLMDLIEVGNDPGECFAIVDLESPEYAPLFADACSPEVTADHDAPEGFQFLIGETTVTWIVDDGHGNTTTATQTVVVSDVEPPTAMAPPDLVVPHDPGTCVAALSDLGWPSATDNCAIANIMNDSSGVFPLGETEVNWYVSDAAGNTTIVTQLVTVTNAPPVADAGDDQYVECTSHEGTTVQLDGTGSSDPDVGDILSYQWSAVGITFDDPTSATPSASFPMGATTVTLQVSDPCGAMSTSDVIIVVEDTTAPQIQALVADHQVLWPPNHKFVPVCVDLLVRDTCAHPEDLNIVCTVSSNEPDDSTGDGSTTGDVDGSDGYASPVAVGLQYDAESGNWLGALFLRAERMGGGDGRKYSLVCTVTDDAGNSTSATACIVVPHDQRGNR